MVDTDPLTEKSEAGSQNFGGLAGVDEDQAPLLSDGLSDHPNLGCEHGVAPQLLGEVEVAALGLNSVVDTTLNLPNIPGMKKLIYTHIDLELTALEEFEEKGRADPLFAALAEITSRHNGLWSTEAEQYLLEHAKGI